jgi:hypothetical protein
VRKADSRKKKVKKLVDPAQADTFKEAEHAPNTDELEEFGWTVCCCSLTRLAAKREPANCNVTVYMRTTRA